MTGYTGFSGDTDEQEGNYIALHFADDEATSIGIRTLGGTDEPKTLDSDGIVIMRMKPDTTGIEVHSVIDGVTHVNRFYFNLVKEEPEDE